jgi:hypothetical protein
MTAVIGWALAAASLLACVYCVRRAQRADRFARALVDLYAEAERLCRAAAGGEG